MHMDPQLDVGLANMVGPRTMLEPEPEDMDPTRNPVIEETIDEDFDNLEIHSENSIPNRSATEPSIHPPISILPPRWNAIRIEGSSPTDCPPALCAAVINGSDVSPLGRLSWTVQPISTNVVPSGVCFPPTSPVGQTRVRHRGLLQRPGASDIFSPRRLLNNVLSPSRYLMNNTRLTSPLPSAAPPSTPDDHHVSHIPTASSSPLCINFDVSGVRSPTMHTTTSLLHTSPSPLAECHSPIFFTPLGMGTLRSLARGGSNISPPQQRRRFNGNSPAPPQDSSTLQNSPIRANGSFPISDSSSPVTISEASLLSPSPGSPQAPQVLQDGGSHGDNTRDAAWCGPVRHASSRRRLMRRVADAHLRDIASDPDLNLCIDMETIPFDRRAGPYTAPCRVPARPDYANAPLLPTRFPNSSRTLDYNHLACLDHSPQFRQHANPVLQYFRPPSPHVAFQPLRHAPNVCSAGSAIGPNSKAEPIAMAGEGLSFSFTQESNNLLRTPNFNNGVVFLGCSPISKNAARHIRNDTSPSL